MPPKDEKSQPAYTYHLSVGHHGETVDLQQTGFEKNVNKTCLRCGFLKDTFYVYREGIASSIVLRRVRKKKRSSKEKHGISSIMDSSKMLFGTDTLHWDIFTHYECEN